MKSQTTKGSGATFSLSIDPKLVTKINPNAGGLFWDGVQWSPYNEVEMKRPDAIDHMVNTLKCASEKFAMYAHNHLVKDPPDTEKAVTNAIWSNRCRLAIDLYEKSDE